MTTIDHTAGEGVEVQPNWLKGASGIHESLSEVKRGKLPKPLFRPSGTKVLVLQDPEEERYGRIIIPKDAQRKYRPTSGVVCAVGDGYDPELTPEGWAEWAKTCPYQVGTVVAWSRYEDTSLKVDVEEDWWDSPEEKERERGKVQFTVLHYKEVIGVFREHPQSGV